MTSAKNLGLVMLFGLIWGGVWTMPAGTDPRIGLISHGKQTDAPTATSRFDYFRVYRP